GRRHPGAVQFRGNGGTGRHRGPCEAFRPEAGGDHGTGGLDLGTGGRRRAAAAIGGRGLSNGARAHHIHHHADGFGRLARGGAVEAARLHGGGFSRVSFRRTGGGPAASGG